MKYYDSIRSRSTQQFLALLRSGLWGVSIDVSLFEENVDWSQIMRLAKEQTVLAVTFDGIEMLPKSCRPSRNLLMSWFGLVSQIEKCNEVLNQRIVEVVGRYNAAGMFPVLLKGQGIGQYYRRPSHRNSGDIDLFFTEGIDAANKLTATWTGVTFQEATKHHVGFTWEGCVVENHLSYFEFYHPQNQKRWERVKHLVPLIDRELLELGSFSISVPSPQMNALYIFLHLWHHFHQKGVGLRHVCDWICLWKACEGKIDKPLFVKTVKMLPIQRPMKAIVWIAENYLGLEKGVIPLNATTQQARRDGELLLADILRMGNFGRATDMMRGFKRGQHLNNLRSYVLALRRQMGLFWLCPSEMVAYPVEWFKGWIVKK